MCKLMIVAGIDDNHRDNAIAFTKKMADIMSVGNSDGLGYAAVNKDGNLFAERWLINSEAFTHRGNGQDESIATMFGKVLKNNVVSKTYTSYGVPNLDAAVSITLHARLATSSRGMANTHPFINEDTSVIHNGVISNDDEFKLTLSTCDSESILISYLQNNVGVNIDAAKAMGKSLRGYYACGMYSRDVNGNRILDVFKGNNPDLHLTYINELGTWVMASREEHIKKACAELGFKCGTFFAMLDGFITRINPITGIVITSREFDVNARWERTPTYTGATEYDYRSKTSRPMNRTLTKEEVHYLGLTPKLTEYSEHYTEEFVSEATWNRY